MFLAPKWILHNCSPIIHFFGPQQTELIFKGWFVAAAATLLMTTAAAGRAEVPPAMEPISGIDTSTLQDTATKNVLALNSSMFELYDNSLHIFQKNILAKHPVILGLFSGAGGRFILYRPGMAPLEAPSVPIVYQLMKSVGHSTMALAEVVMPYLDKPDNQAWRGPLLAYRSRMQSALDGLDVTAMPEDWRANQSRDPTEQHRVHGRLCGEGRHSFQRSAVLCRATGVLC